MSAIRLEKVSFIPLWVKEAFFGLQDTVLTVL